jgi:hypothetical protein
MNTQREVVFFITEYILLRMCVIEQSADDRLKNRRLWVFIASIGVSWMSLLYLSSDAAVFRNFLPYHSIHCPLSNSCALCLFQAHPLNNRRILCTFTELYHSQSAATLSYLWRSWGTLNHRRPIVWRSLTQTLVLYSGGLSTPARNSIVTCQTRLSSAVKGHRRSLWRIGHTSVTAKYN